MRKYNYVIWKSASDTRWADAWVIPKSYIDPVTGKRVCSGNQVFLIRRQIEDNPARDHFYHTRLRRQMMRTLRKSTVRRSMVADYPKGPVLV